MNKSKKIFHPSLFQKKYPIIRQYDQIDCGPAALLSVLKYYGGDASLVTTSLTIINKNKFITLAQIAIN